MLCNLPFGDYHVNMGDSFVILEHLGHGPRHFDFLLEAGLALASWRFEENPVDLPAGGEMPCSRLADHRLEYLEYEGPVSASRGLVRRVEQGRYCCEESGEDFWRFVITGQAMGGVFTLRRQGQADRWLLSREKPQALGD
jgi:hypothetical protein